MRGLFSIRATTGIPAALAAAMAVAWAMVLPAPTAHAQNPAQNEARKADPHFDPLAAVVAIRTRIKPGARTARSLGSEREGSGVVIDNDGLVLTIGYLILEAASAQVTAAGGEPVPAAIIGYDHDTGFGLLRASRPLGVKPAELGSSADLQSGQPVLVVSRGGPRPIVAARVVSRRPFAGYWEYLLENAIFTSPPHPHYGGAALLDSDGRLVGIGSLFVNDAAPADHPVPGNMFVPIDGLKPILADMVRLGRAGRPSHPWLGVYTDEARGRVFITRLAGGGPGERAGLNPGDIIVGVGGKRVADMADFYRKAWARGDAGVDVPLDVLPFGSQTLDLKRVIVTSMDRYRWLKMDGGE